VVVAGELLGHKIWALHQLTQLIARPSDPEVRAVTKALRSDYDATVKQVNCVCGYVVKGEDDDELWEKAQAHLRTDHPDLVGKVSREDILAQAEES
jgi:predicted small metal-binding protein